MSSGGVPHSLNCSSKKVLAGDGGLKGSGLQTGRMTGLTRVEDTELARDKNPSANGSSMDVASEPYLALHRAEIFEIRELMREMPFIDALSERRFFGERGASIQASVRSYPSVSKVER